jgi:hypothetical protein
MARNAKARAGDPGSAADLAKVDAADCSPTRPPPQALRCAGCSVEGRPPTIDWNKDADPRPVLKPVFGWHSDPSKVALLCPSCRGKLTKRAKRRKAIASGGKLL